MPKLFKKTITPLLISLCIVPLVIKADDAKDPLKNVHFEQFRTNTIKILHKNNLHALEPQFDESCNVIKDSLDKFCDLKNQDRWQEHLDRIKKSLDEYHTKTLAKLQELMDAASDPHQKKQLENLRKVLIAFHVCLLKVHKRLMEFKGSGLAETLRLGQDLSEHTHLLPRNLRLLNPLQWKAILDLRYSRQ